MWVPRGQQPYPLVFVFLTLASLGLGMGMGSVTFMLSWICQVLVLSLKSTQHIPVGERRWSRRQFWGGKWIAALGTFVSTPDPKIGRLLDQAPCSFVAFSLRKPRKLGTLSRDRCKKYRMCTHTPCVHSSGCSWSCWNWGPWNPSKELLWQSLRYPPALKAV